MRRINLFRAAFLAGVSTLAIACAHTADYELCETENCGDDVTVEICDGNDCEEVEGM